MPISQGRHHSYDKAHSQRVAFTIGRKQMTQAKVCKKGNTPAEQRKIDAALRRYVRNKAKRTNDPMGLLDNNQAGRHGRKGTVDNLLSTYERAQARNQLIQSLGKVRDNDPQAQKKYKALQNRWYNRGQSVEGFMVDSRSVTVKGKEKVTRSSKPLV